MSSLATIRYNTDPEFRDKRRRQSKAYYDKVKDTEEFKLKNREKVKLWRKKNPDKWPSEENTKYQKQYYITVLKPRRQEARARRTQEDIERIRQYNRDYYHNVRKHKRRSTECIK